MKERCTVKLWLTLATLSILASSCSDSDETHFLNCGRGEAVSNDRVTYCAYSAQLIKEIGETFMCPEGTQSRVDVAGAVVCSSKENETTIAQMPPEVCAAVQIEGCKGPSIELNPDQESTGLAGAWGSTCFRADTDQSWGLRRRLTFRDDQFEDRFDILENADCSGGTVLRGVISGPFHIGEAIPNAIRFTPNNQGTYTGIPVSGVKEIDMVMDAYIVIVLTPEGVTWANRGVYGLTGWQLNTPRDILGKAVVEGDSLKKGTTNYELFLVEDDKLWVGDANGPNTWNEEERDVDLTYESLTRLLE